MTQTPPSVTALARQYEQLCRPLGQLGLISQGSVQDRTTRRGGGAGYQWTRKVEHKTVSVALTREQFEQMKAAVGNYRRRRRQLRELEQLSRHIIFQNSPHLRIPINSDTYSKNIRTVFRDIRTVVGA